MNALMDLICSGAKAKKGAFPLTCGERQPPSAFARAGALSVDCVFSSVWQLRQPEEVRRVLPNSGLACLALAGISSDFCWRERRNAAIRMASTSLNLKFGMRI